MNEESYVLISLVNNFYNSDWKCYCIVWNITL